MTVFQINSSDAYKSCLPDPFFRGSGRQDSFFSYHQAQNRTGKLSTGTGRQRAVITEATRKNRRRTLPALLLAALMVLMLSILVCDLSMVCTAGAHAGELAASVASLENSNALLKNELSAALNHPVLRRQAEAQAEYGTLVTLSAGPAR